MKILIILLFPIAAFSQQFHKVEGTERHDMKGDASFTYKIKGYAANDSFTVVKDSDDLKVITSKGVLVKVIIDKETIPLHFVDLDPKGWDPTYGFIYDVEDNPKFSINLYRGLHKIRILRFTKVMFQR